MSVKGHGVTHAIPKIARLRGIALRPLSDAIDSQCRSRAKLARKYGISPQLWAFYESGAVQPPFGFIAWALAELGLSDNVIPVDVRAMIERPEKGA